MRRRLASWVAWATVGLVLVLDLLSLAIIFWDRNIRTPGDKDYNVGATGFYLATLAFSLVGAIIVTRRHRNAIGWIFLVLGVSLAVNIAGGAYADHALFASRGSLPGGAWAEWVSGVTDPFTFASIMFVLLLFPDGRPPSHRWRPVVWLLLVFTTLSVFWNAFRPGRIFDDVPIKNPAGLGWVGDHAGFVNQPIFVLTLAGFVLSVSAVIVRFRRSRGVERDQMRWLALAVFLLIGVVVMAVIVGLSGAPTVAGALIGVGFASVPIAVGIGVLRYRLYDIDRVISRTLSFAVVTIGLGAAYVGLVLIGQYVFSSVAGGGGLVIAASTLVVAALFLPLRSSVQQVVDRRFNRHRYNTQRTLEAFGTRLRDQVELDQLTIDLRGVVGETMQPEHASVWLRAPEAGP